MKKIGFILLTFLSFASFSAQDVELTYNLVGGEKTAGDNLYDILDVHNNLIKNIEFSCKVAILVRSPVACNDQITIFIGVVILRQVHRFY